MAIVHVDLNSCSMIQCCSLESKTNHIFSFDLTTCYHIDIIDSDVFRDKCISRAGTWDGGHLTGHHVPVGLLSFKTKLNMQPGTTLVVFLMYFFSLKPTLIFEMGSEMGNTAIPYISSRQDLSLNALLNMDIWSGQPITSIHGVKKKSTYIYRIYPLYGFRSSIESFIFLL